MSSHRVLQLRENSVRMQNSFTVFETAGVAAQIHKADAPRTDLKNTLKATSRKERVSCLTTSVSVSVSCCD